MKALTVVLALLIGTLSLPAVAETWYEVEVIVLAHRNADKHAEDWPTAASIPAGLEGALPLPAAQTVTDPRLAALPSGEMRLHAEAQRIAADPNYSLLLHSGWRQPGLAREQAFPLRIYAVAAGGTADSTPAVRLDGTLRLSLSRYLHLDTDLRYLPPHTGDEAQPVYRLQESRRMRSRELHYLDHPLFGVIALITPIEVASPPAAKK